MVYVGLDVARSSHQYEVFKGSTVPVDSGAIPNASWAFEAWCRHIEELFGQEISLVIEASNGLARPLDQYVEKRGWKIVSIPADAVRAYRQNVLRVHDKTDVNDARALGLLAMEAAERYPAREQPRRRLRELTRWRADMTKDKTRTINRLRETVNAYWPELTQADFDFGVPWVCKLFEGLPDPEMVSRLGEHGLAEFFKCQGVRCQKRRVSSIVALAAANSVTAEEKPSLMREARVLARRLGHIIEDIQDIEELIADVAQDDGDVNTLMGWPGIALVSATSFMAEIQDIRNFPDEAALASYAGVALRQEQTGKTKNWRLPQVRANRRLKNCLLQMAHTRQTHDPRSRTFYLKKMGEGKKHLQALRALARHMVRAIYSTLKRRAA